METEEPGAQETPEDKSEEVMTIVRFLPYDGHIMVPVVLNGVLEAHVLVDTGSGITILSRDLARALGLEGTSGKAITLRTMAANIEAAQVTLDSLQIGNLIQTNLPVAITDLPPQARGDFDGILGMDFMNHYKIRIDNANQRIVFSPGK
jgi:clan AA aspartic protease (TIGR02281 family)